MVFWAFLAIYLLIAGLWAIGTPPMSSVDEPSHAIKAAAVVRGQLSGDQAGLRVGTGVVQVPRLFLESQSLVCTAGQIRSSRTRVARPMVSGTSSCMRGTSKRWRSLVAARGERGLAGLRSVTCSETVCRPRPPRFAGPRSGAVAGGIRFHCK
jgi:hypothetical protein